MKIVGLQKLTLLDFPGQTACTVFTAGCNFRCPFCHNSDVIYARNEEIPQEEFFEFLQSRKGKLDGVCITGGEPLLQSDIIEFMAKIRALGFLIKLDTNGSIYGKLEYIIKNRLCDYVAMDVKNSVEKYNLTAGAVVDVQNVVKSIDLLKGQNLVNYEFRTTVVKGLHEIDDFKDISRLISGAKAYYLQQYKDCEKVLNRSYSAYSEEQMKQILQVVKSAGIANAHLRGV